MAILNTGRLVQKISDPIKDSRDHSYTSGDRIVYIYDCTFRKEDPTKIVKWLRKNFGERGCGWDFHFSKGCVIVEIWESKYKTMYELWIV